MLECFTDVQCNEKTGGIGPNKCIRLSSLRELNQKTSNDTETTLRLIQFLINKDPSLFLKYNEILLVLQAQDKDLQNVLDRYGITQSDLANVGACICDQNWQGWRCATPLLNPTPYRCNPNSSVPACTPQNGVCRPSEFLLRNVIKSPLDKLVILFFLIKEKEITFKNVCCLLRLNEYRSYYCECTAVGIVGVNCDFKGNPCNVPSPRFLLSRYKRQQQEGQLANPVSLYETSYLGLVDANQGQCGANPNKDFCTPQQAGTPPNDYKCIKQPLADLVNYLTFDESSRNSNFANPNDNYKRLNVNDATVATGIQSFIRDEVMPRYSFNDYSKIPKGKLLKFIKFI